MKTLEAYLERARLTADPEQAFGETLRQREPDRSPPPYRTLPGLPGVPNACLRLPTGGGKTLLAAHSIAVARKLAVALGVTLDYLVGENELATLRDKAMLERWQTLETLPSIDQERILFVLDSLMRDAKTRQAYQPAAGL